MEVQFYPNPTALPNTPLALKPNPDPTEVHFYASGRNEGEIAGAFVENYLLEKSRVVGKSQRGEATLTIHLL